MRCDLPVREPDWIKPHSAAERLRLGVWLEHQRIREVIGGVLRRARELHGRASAIKHKGRGIFRGLPTPFRSGCYHSLAFEPPEEADLRQLPQDRRAMAGERHGIMPFAAGSRFRVPTNSCTVR